MACYLRSTVTMSIGLVRFSSMTASILTLVLLATSCGCRLRARGSVPGPADEDAPSAWTTTESQLQYRVMRKGNGQFPSAESFVTVDYIGTLESGDPFDNSYERPDSAKFNLTGVIDGWSEGLQLVSEGGMIEMIIPPSLGYGSEGMPGAIPPNATLRFVVELWDVRGG